MKTEGVLALTDTFEGHAQRTETGVEFWLARDLQHLLGYTEWRNFGTVLGKAKTACELSDHAVTDHFVDVNKMVDLGAVASARWTTSCSPDTPAFEAESCCNAY